jgi:hypothetical protein
MAIESVKIPQEIRIEDKIIGPLSLRQLGLTAAGGGLSYAIFASIQKALGFVPVVFHLFIWLPFLLSAAFALLKINNLSLFRLTLLMVESVVKPRVRPWLPRRGINIVGTIVKKKTEGEGNGKKVEGEEQKNLSIADLANVLDKSGATVA